MHAWTADEPLRLLQREPDKADLDPKALACYGLLRDDTGGMLLRFVTGRPVSQVTEDFLGWVCTRLQAEGKKAIAEPGRKLGAREVQHRAAAYYHSKLYRPLKQKVA